MKQKRPFYLCKGKFFTEMTNFSTILLAVSAIRANFDFNLYKITHHTWKTSYICTSTRTTLLLDGQSPVEKLIDKAIANGMRSMAITDHGNMFGALKSCSITATR